MHPVAIELSGDFPLGFAGDDAGMAAHAPVDIDNHAILHWNSPSEVVVADGCGMCGPMIS
jgi:hypothetical protein